MCGPEAAGDGAADAVAPAAIVIILIIIMITIIMIITITIIMIMMKIMIMIMIMVIIVIIMIILVIVIVIAIMIIITVIFILIGHPPRPPRGAPARSTAQPSWGPLMNIGERRVLRSPPFARHLLVLGTCSTAGRALRRQPRVGSPQPQEQVLRPAGVWHLYKWN